MAPDTTRKIAGLVFGAGFGLVLAAARLHEYATIHDKDNVYSWSSSGAVPAEATA